MGISHHMRVFILVCSFNVFLFQFSCTMPMMVFGAKLTASVVQSWSAPSHQALMKWSHDVTPPSPGVGGYPALPAQVSSLSTCDDLLPVKMSL